jgi:hypothetical protein
MAYSDDIRSAVRGDFVGKGRSLAAAASDNGIPYETARSWKRKAKESGDCWDTARAASRLSQGGIQQLTSAILEDFALLFQSTIEDLKKSDKISPLQKAESLSRLSDAYTKTVKAAGASNPELSRLAVAMDIIKRQMDFVRDKYPHHVDAFLEILEPFGEVVSREFR